MSDEHGENTLAKALLQRDIGKIMGIQRNQYGINSGKLSDCNIFSSLSM
jgi:hypothetical protein